MFIDRKVDMNKKANKVRAKRLTDHFTYSIYDNTIYLFQSNMNVSLEEVHIMLKKVGLLVEDYDIAYINISARKIEDRKEFWVLLFLIMMLIN